VITQADLWFVYRNETPAETAAYGIAASFVKYVSAVNVMLGALLPGLVGHLWAKGHQAQLARLLFKIALIGAVAAAAIVGFIGAFGRDALDVLVGPNYGSAWLPLMILSMGHLANSLLGYSQVLLVTAGHTRPIMLASISASSLTLLGLAVATPRWGLTGAACVSAAGVVVYNIIICWSCVRATGIHCHVLAPCFSRPAR
jgi:O-antigen/teichoic acid export membrane protein